MTDKVTTTGMFQTRLSLSAIDFTAHTVCV